MAIRTTGVRYDLIARDSASRQFNNVGNSASKLERGLGKLGKAAAVAGTALAVGIGAALAESTKKAVEFQSSMLKIQTQAGASAKDVAVLSKQVLALGKTTQQGPQQLSEALYHLKSVGMDNVEAMKSLKTASDLAAVGGSNLESTTNALAGAWRTGIKGATSMSEAAKTLNATIGAGNMSMDDMVAALGTGILPTAKTFGLSLSQVGAALALFTDEGVDSASAATRLRMSISLLAAASPAANKQLKTIGLSSNQLGDAMRSKDGIIAAISLLKDHLDKSGLSATKQAALLSRAFGGGKSSSAILSMVNNLDVLRKKQLQVNAGMDKYGPAVTAQRKTVAAQFALIKSNLEVTEIELGNKLLPVLSKVVVFINKTALPAIGTVSSKLMSMVPVAKIKTDFASVTQGVTDFFNGFSPKSPKKKTITLPSPTIKAPATSIPGYLRKTPTLTVPSPTIKVPATKIPSTLLAPKPVQSQAQKMGAQLRTALSGGLGDAVKGLDWKSLGGQLGKGLDSAFGWVAKHTGDIGKKVGAAIASIDWVSVGKMLGTQALPFAIGFVDNMFAPLFSGKFWKTHWWDTIVAVISVIPFDEIIPIAGKLFGKIPWGKLGEIIGKGLEKVPWGKTLTWGKWIGKTAGDASTAVSRFVSMFASAFTESFSHVFPKLGQFFSDQLLLLPVRLGDASRVLVKAGKDMISKLGDAIVNNVPGMGNKFIRGIAKFFGRYTLYQAGTQLIVGLYDGVTGKLDKVGGWIKSNIVDPVVNNVKSWFGIHSPSTVFAGIGGQLISGLKGGITGGLVKIGSWLHSHIVSPVLGALAGAGSLLYSRGASIVTGLKSGVAGVASGLGKWIGGNVVSPVRNAFSGAKSLLSGSGGDLIRGLISGATSLMNSAKSGIGHWASSVKSKIVGAIKDVFGIHSPSTVMAELGGHMMTGLMNGLLQGKNVLNSAVKGLFHSPLDAAQSLLSNGVSLPGKWLSKLFGGKTPGAVSTVGGWATDVRTVLGMLGAPPDALSAVLKRISMESGGNPKAINLTDSNAKAGHPSQGLMQTIPSTFNAYAGPFRSRGITDPMASIYAGVNYAMHRYGKNWISVMTRPGGYARGGLAPIGETAWVGERGPELMQVTKQGTRIYDNKDSLALAKGAGIQIPGYAKGTVSVSTAQGRVNSAQAAVNAARAREDAATTKARRKAAAIDLRAAETRLSAAKKELAAATAAAKRSKTARTTVANALANGFTKTLETGTASAIASAIKSMNTKLQNAGFGSMVAGNLKTSSKLQSLANQKASVASTIATAKQYASDQSSSLGDFLSMSNSPSSTMASLITRMTASQGTASKFAAEIASLSKQGLDKNLLAQVADAGPGSQLAALFSTATASDIKQLNTLAASQSKLTTSFGQQMADSMYDSGSQAGKGFLSGLQAQEKAIQAEMNRLAAGMVSTIKKKLGIKSPSTVFRDQVGKQIAMGVAHGVHLHTPKAVVATQRMADMTAAVRSRNGTVGRAGAGGQVVHHHHETNNHYEINARTADFSVPQLELVQRRSEARQRVGRPR